MDCFGTYVCGQSATAFTASVHPLHFTHAQTCDNVRVRSATAWTASVHTFVVKVLRRSLLRVHPLHMPKPVITLVFEVLRHGLLRYIRLWSKCYGMQCFGTSFTHAQTCDNVRVRSPTAWTASVHTFVVKVLRRSLLRCTLYTCPNLWWPSCSKSYVLSKTCPKMEDF